MVVAFALAAGFVTVASGHGEDPGKLGAVNKVIGMLEDLQQQCVDEGTKEAKSYDGFACYCKETTKGKAEAIQRGEDETDRLEAKVGELGEKRGALDESIQTHQEKIDKTEKEIKEANEERAKELAVYERNEADLAGAVFALEGAIKTMKAGKSASLLQTDEWVQKLRDVAIMADAMGWGGAKPKRLMAMLIHQSSKVPEETYSYHSDSIIKMLEELLTDFKAQRSEVDGDESKAAADHKAVVQRKKKIVEDTTQELNDDKKSRSKTIVKLGSTSEDLTASAATLLDDQEYMTTLSKMCSDKAQTWDQRSKVRADELNALTAAISIMKDKVKEKTSSATVRLAQQAANVRMAWDRVHSVEALDEAETEAEEVEGKAPANFLQRGATPRKLLQNVALISKHQPSGGLEVGRRQAVITLLRSQSSQLKSQMLASLASQLSADPLAKVKTLIQELIQRLLAEAGSEGNHKGFCDKAMSDAKQKREYAAEKIESLNSEMAELEARRDKLIEDLDVLGKELAELDEKQEVASKMRKEESAENEATVKEAKAGLDAVKEAIDILDKFYKTAAKEEVKLELVQGPEDDAPDAGFDDGEAYTGAQGSAGGVLGMMDVIQSDFERTLKVTNSAEKEAATEYNDFMTESGKSIAEKEMAEKEKTKQKNEDEDNLEEATEDLDTQVEKLQTSLEELLDLKPTCVDTGMSFEERESRRQDEIDSLKKALCIFENFQDLADSC